MTTAPATPTIRARPAPRCPACGAAGESLYRDLTDALYSAPGRWSMRRCTGTGCGLLWLDPMPLEDDLGLAYGSYYTHDDTTYLAEVFRGRLRRAAGRGYLAWRFGHYPGTPAWQRLVGRLVFLDPWHRPDFDFSAFHLPARPGGRLLEIGSGSGQMVAHLSALGWEAEGVDTDPAAVAQAVRQGRRVAAGTLMAQRYPTNRFDAVVLSHVIEHVPEPRALLRECQRVLSPGGRLVLVTPNARSWGHRHFGSAWRGLEPPRHLHVFTPRALADMVRRAGFRRQHTSTSVRGADGLFAVSRAMQRTGRPPRAGLASRPVRAWARALQLCEWLLLWLDREAGEEIVLVARK